MMNPAANPQEKRTIKVKDFLADFHAGIDDSQLLIKYHLTPVGLDRFYSMLVERGILEEGEVQARYSLPAMGPDLAAQAEAERPSFICPACLAAHDTMFDICPCCGVSFQELMNPPKGASVTKHGDEDCFIPGQQQAAEQNSEFFAAPNTPSTAPDLDLPRFASKPRSAVVDQPESADKYSLRGNRNSFDDPLDEIVTGMPLEEYYSEGPETPAPASPKCESCDSQTKPALRDIYDRTRSLHVLAGAGIALLLGFFSALVLSLFDGYSFGRLLVVYLTALLFLAGGVLLTVGSFLYFAREKVFYCANCQRIFPRA